MMNDRNKNAMTNETSSILSDSAPAGGVKGRGRPRKDPDHPRPLASSTPKPDTQVQVLSPGDDAAKQSEIPALMSFPPPPIVSIDSVGSSAQVEDPLITKHVSRSTGLTVITVSSLSSGHQITAEDRVLMMKILPNVVVLNIAGRNDALLIGVDARPDQVMEMIPRLEQDHKNWSFCLEDVSHDDPFSYFSSWKIIPKVDKQGVYSLIVYLRVKGRSKGSEAEEKRNLVNMIKEFNLLKVIHGECETMIQVGHVLEFVAYSDCIRKMFTIERKHTWQVKPLTPAEVKTDDTAGLHRYFWIKVDHPEMKKLSVGHKQYSLNQHLKSVGNIIQLEHQLFGVEDHYLAVFDDQEKLELDKLGPQFMCLEVSPMSLPDSLIPTYGVDNFGFYTVSGIFPPDLSNEIRDKFASDMKIAGAVGFRTGSSDDEFSLHFVNSSSLEKISKLSQYNSFNLKINSSMIKKPKLEKKIKKLVPAILKIKEAQTKASDELKPAKKVTIVEEDCKTKESEQIYSLNKVSGTPMKISHATVPASSVEKHDVNEVKMVKTKPIAKVQEVIPTAPELIKTDHNDYLKKEVVKPTPKINIATKQADVSKDSVTDNTTKINLGELMKVNWLHGNKGTAGFSRSFARFLLASGDVEVGHDEVNGDVQFRFKERKSFVKQLKWHSRNETNTLDKLTALSSPRFAFVGAKYESFKNVFGLAIPKKKLKDQAAVEKHLAGLSGYKVEDRASVFIIWFQSSLDYFRVFLDKKLNVGFNFCIVNYEELGQEKISNTINTKTEEKKPEEVVTTETESTVTGGSKSPATGLKLTEKQVFDFVWKNPNTEKFIRDNQVISRQLTEFIKRFSFNNIENGDDGLVFNFASKKDYDLALNDYCKEAIGNEEMLNNLARKFTLIPSRGSYGIFCAKRLRQDDLNKLGTCHIFNSSFWFSSKMDMIRVLTDPVLNQMYPLYIDCRNIFILRQTRFEDPLYKQQQMAQSSYSMMPLRRRFSDYPATGPMYQGPRSSYTRGSRSVLHKFFPRQDHFNDPGYTPYQGKFRYNFTVGKFGVFPSSRMIRNGYKMYKVPSKGPRDFENLELFLEDKDHFRNKNVEEAADEVKNLLTGADEGQGTLREMKMKRVELFLREKLGVENLQFGPGSQGPNIFVNLIEGGLDHGRLEEVADTAHDTLTPDLLGLYTIILPFTDNQNLDQLITQLQEDISWFETPVSVLPVTNPVSGDLILEVKMKNEDVAIAAYRGLKTKYPTIDVDRTGKIQ